MDAVSVTFQDGSVPKWGNDAACLGFSKPINYFLDNLHVTLVVEESIELNIGSLEYTEGCVARPINDLNVFHLTTIRFDTRSRCLGGELSKPAHKP